MSEHYFNYSLRILNFFLCIENGKTNGITGSEAFDVRVRPPRYIKVEMRETHRARLDVRDNLNEMSLIMALVVLFHVHFSVI